jgi:UDP-glucose 4-epimerase
VFAAIEQQLGMKLRIEWKPGRPLDVPVSVVAIERAKHALGWEPRTSFEAGLEKTIEWGRQLRTANDKRLR